MTDYRQRFRSNKRRYHEATIANFAANNPPSVFYNIGVGPKSEADTLKRIWPQLQCFGCEPNPQMYEWWRNNGKFPGRLFEFAIADQPRVTLYAIDDLRNSSLIDHRENSVPCEVEAVTLDEFDHLCAELEEPLDNIMLWMDIEGWELEALKTGPDLLSSGRVRWINLEEHKHDVEYDKWAKSSDLRNFLADLGYIRQCVYNRHPTHHDVIYRHNTEPTSWNKTYL